MPLPPRALPAAVVALPAPPGQDPLLMHSGVHAGLVVLKAGDQQRGRWR